MNKRKRFLLIYILGVISISVPIAAADSPDAKELLRRFTEARKNFTSFIFECEATNTFNYPQRNWNGKRYSKLECRFDGNRGRTRNAMWGKVDIRSPNVSENQAHYTSDLWDGENYYSYNRGYRSDSGHVMLSRGKDPGGVPKAYKNRIKGSSIVPGQIMGYPRGDNGKRIDEVLDLAESLELRQEKLRGVDCYVIEAVVKGHGKYTVWIDPTHDYHLAKIHIHRKENDYFENRRAGKKDSIDMVFEVLHFEQIGDLWFPKQCKLKRTICDNGDCGTEDESINITNIVLNPDHDALKSFIPDDIPNGATVNIVAFPPSMEFTWQNGKVVDKTGRVIMDSKTKKPAGSTSEPKSKSQTKKHPTALELLDKYTQALESLRSIIVKAESTTEHEYRFSKNWNESGYRGVGDAGTSYKRTEFRTDGERIHLRTYHWGHISSMDSSVSEEQPMYICHNYANGQLYRHSAQTAPDARGFVMLNKPQYMSIQGDMDRFLTGYVIQTFERVDSILRRAESISVRPKTESVGGSDCYVIYAKTDSGRISLWIDPAHGYNVARAESRGTQGNLYYGRPLTRGQVVSSRIEHVRFEKIDGIRVPVEMDFTMDNQLGPGSFSRQKCHYKRTEVVVNPDHEALGSFDDPLENPENDPLLRNGTRIKMEGGLRGVWLNGKVVDKTGRVIADFRKNSGKAHKESDSDAKR